MKKFLRNGQKIGEIQLTTIVTQKKLLANTQAKANINKMKAKARKSS